MSETRHGKHKDGNVLLGSMVEPRKKAIALVTAAALAANGKPVSTTELIWRGIENLAISAGVLDPASKQVTMKFSDAVNIAEGVVKGMNTQNRGTRGGKRCEK